MAVTLTFTYRLFVKKFFCVLHLTVLRSLAVQFSYMFILFVVGVPWESVLPGKVSHIPCVYVNTHNTHGHMRIREYYIILRLLFIICHII